MQPSARSVLRSRMADTEYLINRYSGTLDLAHQETESILRVAIHACKPACTMCFGRIKQAQQAHKGRKAYVCRKK